MTEEQPPGEGRRPRRKPQAPDLPPLQPRQPGAGGTGRGGISQARAYTPRGRTVRETGPAAIRDSAQGRPSPAEPAPDARRPSLRLVAGGSDAAPAPTQPASRRPARPASSRPGGTDGRRTPPVGPRPRKKATATGPLFTNPFRRPSAPLGRFEPNRRLRVGTVIMLLIFATFGGRLVQLQLTDGRAFAAAGLRDRLTTTVLPAARGSILDRDGNVLAESIEARYIYADPSRVVNPAATAMKLRDLLAVPADQLMPKLTDKTQSNGRKNEFVYLARGLDIPTANAVMALDLAGIGEGLDQRRENPGHDLAANLIGFVGTDQTGLAGLEYADNSLLAGRNGTETYEIGDGKLITKLPGGYDQITPARSGSSLQLTIDSDMQWQVQQALFTRMTAANADFGAAIVMKVSTGEVLAQASYPSYDAAAYADYPQSAYKDAATQITVDPGSSAKVVAIGAALNTGAITPQSTVTLPGGHIVIGGTTYRDDTPFPKGTKITLPGILAYSSNLGTINITSKLSSSTIYQYQHLFGLGTPTGEGVQNEAAGDLLPPSQWTSTSWGSIPIGEGLSATPLQMTAAYCAIANNGTWIQPHIVKAVIGPDGKATPSAAPKTHEVLTPAVAAQLRTALEAVTTAQGATATRAAVKGYVIAGKTGTGQQYLNGGYLPGYAISFIGMAPADHPQYVIGVFAHVPSGSGGLWAAPAFRDMMTFALQHYQVPATGDKAPTFQLTLK